MTTDILAGPAGQVAIGDEPGEPAASPPDRGQLDALFRAQGPRLIRALTRKIGRRDDAADLIQEAFLRLTRAAAASQCLKRVVFVLSSASFCRGTGPYAFSKAAELDLCRLLANELAPRGVRVDAIALGWTETAMAARAADATGRRLDDVARQHPHGVLLDPVEIGELCAALLFDHADGAPGQLIVWDLRDGSEPVWRALDGAAVEAEFASNDHCILDAQPRKPLAGRN